MASLNRFKPWFLAAAIYNVVWGLWVSIWPESLFAWLGMPAPVPISLWQCVGMMVGVYGLGYWLVFRDPKRYGAFAIIGLIGKILGPIGFAMAWSQGVLPGNFIWVNVANDLFWFPAFGLFALAWVRGECSK